ncbi:MAG: serine hydrolase [Burkholderiales bacterium]|nr:serine hydrolase [Burkholderiales bacterium]
MNHPHVLPCHPRATRAIPWLWLLLALFITPLSTAHARDATARRFVFGTGPAAAGEVAVRPDTRYTPERGHGFEGHDNEPALTPAVAGPRTGQPVLAPKQPVHFSVRLPEGSYRITATLGGSTEASDTTIKAELRRLMLQGVRTAPRQAQQLSFTVHVRTPQIPAAHGVAAGQVLLRAPRETVDEAWSWDQRLTLEVSGPRPVLQALDIEPVQVPLLFLLGDSTVADQSQEPYASWGQMLPRYFGPTLAVVSLAQSGETYRDALTRRRLDKILSLARPGDTVLMQYGHNDQKQLRDGSGSVLSYQQEIRQHVHALRARQLQPVIVTSVERRFFDAQGQLQHTLAEHVAAARAVAAELQVPLLDLNTTSRQLYEALGPQRAPALFATGADGRVDPTHHNNTGAWLLAGLVAQGLRDAQLPVATHLRADAPQVQATRPPALDTLDLVPSARLAQQRPAGDTNTAGDTPAAADVASAPPSTPPSADAAATSAQTTERLARLDRAISDEIERGRLAGAVVWLARDGQLLHQRALGWADREQRVPMRADTLFRLASMSKAVTTVAAMMLYEEGHFLLRDPISKWLPAFADVRVAVPAGDGQPPRLEKPQRPITVRDLLQHTAGLSYGAGPAAAAWQQAGFTDWYILHRDETLAQWTERLARLPLQGQPGEAWIYGYATDVLGRLVELWSGLPLERFVAERITGPLRMPDTHFFVPPEKAARLANVYALEQGRLVLKETAAQSDFIHGPRKLPSGGAGLVATAGDYARFLQMLLNGGTLDGVRLLNPATVAMMHRDHLGARYTGDAEGAGFGFWVSASPGTRSELASPGAYGWGSAYSPQYVVDPSTRSLFIYLAQLRPPGDSTLHQRVKVLARQALLP